MGTAAQSPAVTAQSSTGNALQVLVQRMRDRDQAALTQLYETTVSRVFGLAVRIAGNHHDAEEITCDVYARAWQNAYRYDAQRASVTAWLMLMTRSRALDFLRGRATRAPSRLHPVGADSTYIQCADQAADRFAMASEESSRLRDAMSALTPAQCKLIGLAFFEGLSHEQLAARTGIALGTVKSHIRRGLSTLKLKLDDFGLGDDENSNQSYQQSRRDDHRQAVRDA